MIGIVARIRPAVTAAAIALIATFAIGSLLASPAGSTTFTRNPYVNLVTPSSATIAWHTDTPTSAAVIYTKDLATVLAVNDAASDTIHAITLASLDPDQIYFYRIVAGTDTLTDWSDYFTTAPTPSISSFYHFVVFGDLGAATTDQMDLAAEISSRAPNFALLPGNIVAPAGQPENFDPQFFQIYQSSLAYLPFYTALGEQDVATNNGQPYLDNFYLPTNSATNTERYYSFDYGNAHFVSLEVTQENTTPDAQMLTWLDQDLAGSAQYWKFVFFHVAAYSNAGGHGGDPTIAAALEPIFANRGVDMVFQGHNHFYTRTYPLVNGAATNTADEPHYVDPSGPIWITTGGGGATLDPIASLSSIEAVSVSDYHFTDVFIAGSVLAVETLSSTGATLDTMSVVKNPTTAIELADFRAAGEPDGVRLRWRRVDGGSDGGFNVYRGPGAAGPWTRLNAELLQGASSFEYFDRDAQAGVDYAYRLGIVDGQGNERATAAVSASRQGPLRFALERPRPNPTRGSALIPFSLDRAAPTRVMIVDVAGRVVRTLASRAFPAGANALTWDGRDGNGRAVASGVYFAVVRSGGHEARTRIALLR